MSNNENIYIRGEELDNLSTSFKSKHVNYKSLIILVKRFKLRFWNITIVLNDLYPILQYTQKRIKRKIKKIQDLISHM